ncbi:integrase [Natranaerobius trueperi]|uniref:Integrase n=1 Tax=Natranaerobius trueperi TaxID=759412 RepID=A0A226BX73_9FIRM|nr:integrase [Natranaerobius trueperi]
MSSFFNHCREEGWLSPEKKLLKKIWNPRIPKKLPIYYDSTQLSRIRMKLDKIKPRDKAILELLLSCGWRRSELTNLNLEDINLDKKSAKIYKGKGNKPRTVYFSINCRIFLKQYLKERIAREGDDALFLNYRGERISSDGIYKILKSIEKKLDLNLLIRPHTCRHSFATEKLSRGLKLKLISYLLGHNDLNTTMIYIHILTEDMKYEYEKRIDY